MPGSYYSDVERTIYLTYYILMEDIAKYDELFQQERKFITFEYFTRTSATSTTTTSSTATTSALGAGREVPETKDGPHALPVRDHPATHGDPRQVALCVNSIDVVFNFDCIGFTGTPFIDNYPTFAYIRSGRQDKIPDLIDRRFYAYTSEALTKRSSRSGSPDFQGKNSNVLVEYVPSDFMQAAKDELAILSRASSTARSHQDCSRPKPSSNRGAPPPSDLTRHGFRVRDAASRTQARRRGRSPSSSFNVLVDLCGVFKKTSIHEVRDLVLRSCLARTASTTSTTSTRPTAATACSVIDSDSDVQFDEEFYKFLCKAYGAKLREKIFFFIDNRNVIGKDIPFQLIYQRASMAQPLFYQSVDPRARCRRLLSKIWQAMGRSRTMNDTRFTIYKSR